MISITYVTFELALEETLERKRQTEGEMKRDDPNGHDTGELGYIVRLPQQFENRSCEKISR